MAQRIDGKAVAAKLRQQMAGEVQELARQGVVPRLVVIIVGEDPASQLYVRNKMKACQEVGIDSQRIEMPEDTTQEALLEQIDRLNQDPETDGILVQLPLPRQIDPQTVIDAIDPEKDVDAFHPLTVGRMEQGQPTFLPCTPAGILELLREYPGTKELPPEVAQRVAAGETPLAAMRAFELAQMRAQLAAKDAAQKNRQTAPGSAGGLGGKERKDDFEAGFDAGFDF